MGNTGRAKPARLASKQKERLLRDIWIAHDARWFLKSAQEVGFDTATSLNLAVAKSIGKTEIKLLLAALDYLEIKDIEDFNSVMEIAADVYFPEDHRYSFEMLDESTFVGHVIECSVYKNVNKAGTTDIHQCGGKARFDSWLQALGLSGEIIAEKNTSNCGGTCDFVFKIMW